MRHALVADSMVKHPNKHIREAIRYAEQSGWTFVKAGARAHIFGQLFCPRRGRDGHIVRVHSTPADPESHARKICRAVDNCAH